jgi:glycosyltransferase involved in cell wall biosynthesis
MDEKSLCILGCCKNVEQYLPQVLNNLDTIKSWWKECKIVIFENDSTDNTSKLLLDWVKEKGDHREIVQEVDLNKRFPVRTMRLAYIRNRLLHYIHPSFDYFMFIDMDNVLNTPVDKESFESCFKMNVEWDMVTANSKSGYYDIWALRIPGLMEIDCWDYYNRNIRFGEKTSEELLEMLIYKWNRFMNESTAPIELNSGFNTAMICKVSALRRCCRYNGFSKDYIDNAICEHVSFCNCIRSHGAKIYFNPDFKI